MPDMSFLPELQRFLRDNKVIYTVRKYKMVEADVEVEGVGTCRRIPMGEISSKDDLLPYVGYSGFFNVETWWNKIKQFIPSDGATKYLYKVSKGAG